MSWKGTAIPTTGTEILELQPFLKYLADCIRTKKETTEPINAQDFGKEILKISGGAKLNIEYANTPPADTSKLWLNCNEPSGVEIQNYLGNASVSDVANYGVIENPTTRSDFYGGYFSTCYIGNNQIAIVGYNHIRIYDLTTKSYIADYEISGVGIGNYYTNVILKDNVLYFGYGWYSYLYSFNLTTQTLTKIGEISSKRIAYIFFNSDSEIYIFAYPTSGTVNDYLYKYDIANAETTMIAILSTYYISNTVNSTYGYSIVKTNNFIYFFGCRTNWPDYYWKFNLSSKKFETFTSWENYVESLGVSYFQGAKGVYDGDRYIYIIGGGYGGINYNNLIKYDTVNDTFEMLEQKLITGKYFHLVELIDNRVYIFGGKSDTNYGRPNQIDYFDLKYPLNENNAIVTTNAINTDIMVNLINEDTFKLKSNVASAYIGNADNLAEKVNAYYHNGNAWLGINTSNPFTWKTVEEQNLFLGETITLEAPLTNNFGWKMTYNVISDLEVSNNSNTLTINGGSALGTYPITVTATSSEYNSVYDLTFNTTVNEAITWSTIADQTCNVNTTLTLDLSTYYTNNSSYDVTLSASSSDNTNFEVSITGNTLTVNCLAVANTTITIEAIVLGITYSVSFSLTAS